MKEHQAYIIKKKLLFIVFMHTVDTGHGFDIDNVKVLNSHFNFFTVGNSVGKKTFDILS